MTTIAYVRVSTEDQAEFPPTSRRNAARTSLDSATRQLQRTLTPHV
jgi:DNA invertase Pin-like site-specific DNA recombinase